MRSTITILGLTAALLACGLPVAAQQNYHVVDQWKVGGEDGWDYLAVDSKAQRLYVTRGARVDVLDTQSGKVAGSIANLHRTHGVALDSAGKLGYISDGGGNAVVVFDRATLATVATIPAGTNPDGILFDAFTRTVWAFNGGSKNVSVVDAATAKVVATTALPGKPEFPASDGKGAIYVNIEDKNEIVRLDAKTHAATATWPLHGCDSPSGLALDRENERLFSVCDGKKMAVTNAKDGSSLALVEIGDGPDAAAYAAKLKLAFSSNGEGNLTVVDASAAGYPVLETVETRPSARTMAYDPHTDKIYLAAADFARPQNIVPAPGQGKPRPTMVPGSFTILVVGR